MQTQPIFILSSGRSGTQMMEKLISTNPSVEIHHEYLCNIIQPLGAKFYMGLVHHEQIVETIRQTYAAAVHHCNKPLWIDSSNKLSWIVPGLIDVFPQAKFVHIVRDGRRVSSSYFNKLADECYEPECVRVLADFVSGRDPIAPPPEKKYWWPLENNEIGALESFCRLSQFEQISRHWQIINDTISAGLKAVPDTQKFFCRLEDLVIDESLFADFVRFLQLPQNSLSFSELRRPHNVNRPQSFELTEDQIKMFWSQAQKAMTEFGYDKREDYQVRY